MSEESAGYGERKQGDIIICEFGRCRHNRDGVCKAKVVRIVTMRTADVFYDLFPFCHTAVVVDA